MRHFLIFFTILILTVTSSLAGPISPAMRRLLASHNIYVEDLESSGQKLLAGEFTGAGGKVLVDDINIFITKKDVIYLKDVHQIKYRRRSNRPEFKDISFIKIRDKTIINNKIKGLIVNIKN